MMSHKKPLVQENQGLKSKYCKKDDTTTGHTNSRNTNDWIRSAIDECKKVIGKKGIDKTTTLSLFLIVDFLNIASKPLGAHK